MVVGEEHQCLHQLCQRPAVLPWLQQSLQCTAGVGETPPHPSAVCSPQPSVGASQWQGYRSVFGKCLTYRLTGGKSSLPIPLTPSALKGLNPGGLCKQERGPWGQTVCSGGNCAGSIRSHLDVLLGDEPGPVRQQLVDLIEVPEFLRGTVQPLQPCGVAPHLQELRHVQPHQVGAAVPGCCLWGERAVSPQHWLRDPHPATSP